MATPILKIDVLYKSDQKILCRGGGEEKKFFITDYEDLELNKIYKVYKYQIKDANLRIDVPKPRAIGDINDIPDERIMKVRAESRKMGEGVGWYVCFGVNS